mmetsp:Transcript_10147/g.18535  ORF Transcript_10147/g.18535 Transcript_10147/m.18535 type:complete len:205 (-) Transcript_10147:54-668(-)
MITVLSATVFSRQVFCQSWQAWNRGLVSISALVWRTLPCLSWRQWACSGYLLVMRVWRDSPWQRKDCKARRNPARPCCHQMKRVRSTWTSSLSHQQGYHHYQCHHRRLQKRQTRNVYPPWMSCSNLSTTRKTTSHLQLTTAHRLAREKTPWTNRSYLHAQKNCHDVSMRWQVMHCPATLLQVSDMLTWTQRSLCGAGEKRKQMP